MDFYKKSMIYLVLKNSNALPFQKLMNSTEEEYEDLLSEYLDINNEDELKEYIDDMM